MRRTAQEARMSTDGLLTQRSSGILLHPTSLPGPHGSGDFGPSAYHFVEWLKAAGQSLWQTLPLGPIGPGNSPYMGSSAFAGNPLLVAFEPMVENGWLPANSLANDISRHRIDFSLLVPWRMARLRVAFAGMKALNRAGDAEAMAAFARAKRPGSRITRCSWRLMRPTPKSLAGLARTAGPPRPGSHQASARNASR